MGRLFWKFFLFLWLAQVVTTFGVGIAIWLLHPDRGEQRFERPPPAHVEGSAPPAALPPPAPGEAGDDWPRSPGPPPPPHSPLPPLLPLIAGSLVSLVFAALLAWYFARPIRNLGQAFESVAAGRLDTRIGPAMGRRHDELADLGSGFDSMAERLQGLVDRQRRLLHDVSHEMRSPLARVQAAVDLMRQQPERSLEFIERIERDTGRMDRLVGELLTLARLDAGIPGNISMSVDLSALIRSIVEDAKLEAEPKRCRVEVSVTDRLVVRGNQDLIRRAIENVVRNALRHTPYGGRIFIATRSARDRIDIEVADEGKGVAEADLKAIFEPFFRSVSEDAFSGYGLGLAITRSIVEAHGGEIHARNRSEGGLVVTIGLCTTGK